MIDTNNIISRNFDNLRLVINEFSENQFYLINQISDLITKTLINGNCIFWCGNGGSAAQSQHLAAELIGRFKENREPYKSFSLNSDSSIITCIANDFGFNDVFARQLEGLGNEGDLLIVLSTSGNSINIRNAIIKAKSMNIRTISLLGKDGGLVKGLANYSLIINSKETSRVQEMHLLIGHIICEIVEGKLIGKN